MTVAMIVALLAAPALAASGRQPAPPGSFPGAPPQYTRFSTAELMRGFVENRIRPYYLHHPDLEPGTIHFRVSIAEGQALVKGLRGRISGLAQPTYILDIPGGHGKAVIEASTIRDLGDGCYAVEDFRGVEHHYPPAG